MNKKRKQLIEQNEVSEIRTFSLGGYQQKVLIEGKSRKAPVIIFLHGGPGAPIPFSEGCRGMLPEHTDESVMVYWDQFGCGINNHQIEESVRISDFVRMTTDLVKEIKKEFPHNRLLLFGVSWGSILAIKTALEIPELIDNVVTFGQVLHSLTFNDEVYEALHQAGLSAKEAEKLQKIRCKEKHTAKDIKTVMMWIRKYTEGYQCKSGGKTSIFPMLMGMLNSPDYKFKDFKALMINGYNKNTSLIEEVVTVDLREDFKQLKVPCHVLQGSTDIVTSSKAVGEFVKNCGNDKISFKMIPDCGHMPNGNAMKIIHSEIHSRFQS